MVQMTNSQYLYAAKLLNRDPDTEFEGACPYAPLLPPEIKDMVS